MSAPRSMPYTYAEIDSDNLPMPTRFLVWRETEWLPMAAEPAGEGGRSRFRIRVRRLSGRTGRFFDLTAGPMTLRRNEARCSADGLDGVSLTVLLGSNVQHQLATPGRSVAMRPGTISVKDFRRPATAYWKTPARSLSLHLPRLTVDAAIGDKLRNLHGSLISGGALTSMLHEQLLALGRIAPRLNNRARAAALDATVHLATAVLRCELGGRLEDKANDAGLFAAAQLYIRQHLGCPDLSPGLIARQFKCSRAHLYRVFAGRGQTVAKYIREMRLQQALDLLAGNLDARIGDIAHQCGIEDPVLFSRLFRQRFELTPSAYRAGIRPTEPSAAALAD
jgi:AraC-like DNA-binding protein